MTGVYSDRNITGDVMVSDSRSAEAKFKSTITVSCIQFLSAFQITYCRQFTEVQGALFQIWKLKKFQKTGCCISKLPIYLGLCTCVLITEEPIEVYIKAFTLRTI